MSVSVRLTPGGTRRSESTEAQASDCESEASEVLSVGHEPAQTLIDPSNRELPSAPSSPCSMSPAASSPGLCTPLRHPELECSGAYRGIGIGSRMPLSPPTTTCLTGLQLTTSPLLLPSSTGCHQPGILAPTVQPALHRLSVDKLLRQESPEPQGQPLLLLNGINRMGFGLLNGINDNATSSNSGSSSHANSQHQSSLKFSIDNILKADFGRRITDPITLKKSRVKKSIVRPIDLSKDFYLESSSEGSERSSERGSEGTRNVSPSLQSDNSPTSANIAPTVSTTTSVNASAEPGKLMQWPAWVYCTRYSDRPSSGRSPRTRRPKRSSGIKSLAESEEKRPRTAFSADQLARLKREFAENKYLTEQRRQMLSKELGLNEAQIKIWFQNKRAKIKKASGQKNPLALQLMAQGLYNHSTVPLSKEEIEQAAELQAN